MVEPSINITKAEVLPDRTVDIEATVDYNTRFTTDYFDDGVSLYIGDKTGKLFYARYEWLSKVANTPGLSKASGFIYCRGKPVKLSKFTIKEDVTTITFRIKFRDVIKCIDFSKEPYVKIQMWEHVGLPYAGKWTLKGSPVYQKLLPKCNCSSFKGKKAVTYYPDKNPVSKALKEWYIKTGEYATLTVDFTQPQPDCQMGSFDKRPDGNLYNCLECQINDFKKGYMWSRWHVDANCKYDKNGKYALWVKYPAYYKVLRNDKIKFPGLPAINTKKLETGMYIIAGVIGVSALAKLIRG